MSSASLPIKQQLFIAAYVANKGNGTQAAIAAGYAQSAAAEIASRLLAKSKVRQELEKRIAKLTDRYAVTDEKIINELAKIAFANVGDFIAIQDDGSAIVDLSTATQDQLASLGGIETDTATYVEDDGADGKLVRRTKVKLKHWDKRAALMDLAKLRTMLPADRLQISGLGGGPVEIEHTNRNVDLSQLGADQREQLRSLLLAAKRGGPVTDVEEVETEEDGEEAE